MNKTSSNTDHQALMKKALHELREMKARLSAMEREKTEPIAIIGMGCRFPGGADSPEAFWQLLREGRDAITEVPPERWDIDAFYDPDPDAPGKMVTRHGGFSGLVDSFDAAFFGITPREAQSLDPKQRALLEVSWQALEQANQVPEHLFGTSTGVFIGIGDFDYTMVKNRERGSQDVDAYFATGSALCVAAGRLSYALGLTGPSMAVDTACSSSLTAVHLACQSLRGRECDLALAGGVNVLLAPDMSINFSKTRMLAPDGRCKTFDAAADGYVRGEGCGIVVLKRLSDAIGSQDRILAVIRGSAVNQDGASGGLTVPSGPSQEEVIRRALAFGNIEPDQVGYVEAHGTGTTLGDPIEVAALGNVFCRDPRKHPLIIGSVKTNVGHLEASAGVAGLIKAVLSVEHGEIPPHLHFQRPSPHIAWDQFEMEVPTKPQGWPSAEGPRIAGVSAFGFSGTNVHVVIEEFRDSEIRNPESRAQRPIHLLTLSAKTETALKELAARYEDYLTVRPYLTLEEICFTANTCRSSFGHRLAVVAPSLDELREKLDDFRAGRQKAGLFTGQAAKKQAKTPGDLSLMPDLNEGAEAWRTFFERLGQSYVQGSPVDWYTIDQGYFRKKVTLPTYPFQRKPHWDKAAHRKFETRNTHCKTLHPLLGCRLSSALEEIQFESHIGLDSPPYTKDHCVHKKAILPAAAYLEMALKAGAIALQSNHPVLKDVVFQEPLILDADHDRTVQLVLKPNETNRYSFQIFSLIPDEEGGNSAWMLHASGTVLAEKGDAKKTRADISGLKERYRQKLSVQEYYQGSQDTGIDYGPTFQGIEAIWKRDEQALGRIRLPDISERETDKNQYLLHPVMLDCAFQLLKAVSPREGDNTLYLPIGLDRLEVCGPSGGSLWSEVQMSPLKEAGHESLTASLRLFAEDGNVVADIAGLTGRRVRPESLFRPFKRDLTDRFCEVVWEPLPDQQAQGRKMDEPPGAWLVFGRQDHPMGRELSAMLKDQGEHCIMVYPGESFRAKDRHTYEINPSEVHDFHRLIQDISGNGLPPCRGLVHLWGVKEKPQGDTGLSALEEAQTLGCETALHIVQGLVQAGWSPSPRLWLVTQGVQSVGDGQKNIPLPFQAPLWGLGPVTAMEHPELQCVCLDLDPRADGDAMESSRTLFKELFIPHGETQVAWRQGLRYAARLTPRKGCKDFCHSNKPAGVQGPIRVKLTEYGSLENLTLEPMTRREPGPGEVEIEVRAAGLNFRDVLHALGMLKEASERIGILSAEELPLGFECAGTIVSVGKNVSHLKVGDDVIAALAIGSLSSFVTLRAEFVVLKPEAITFEGAATLSTTFLTALYGLHRLARIRPGERVLIHAASGGVGLSAVQLVQQTGAEVFATASAGKRPFLESLGVEHIMDSRTLYFADEIMAKTAGQGVDVVLNSLNGEFIPHSLKVLKEGGRFVEIGKIGIWHEQQIHELRPDISYFHFDLGEDAEKDPALISSMLNDLVHGIEDGALKPLPHKVFTIGDTTKAFRYMAQARHTGKVVISHQGEEKGEPGSQGLMADQSSLFSDHGTYLISGGLGALGLQIANWMVQQGARHLLLMGRGPASIEAEKAIEPLRNAGAEIFFMEGDVSSEEDVKRLLGHVKRTLPELKGVIHAAGVLDDGMITEQTRDRFQAVMRPKTTGAWNLHRFTQGMALDFFVMFSSAASLLGNPGQSNYAGANAFLDILAHYRRSKGLPATTINWGPWAGRGMAASQPDQEDRFLMQGVRPIKPEEGLQILGTIIRDNPVQLCVVDMDWGQYVSRMSVDATSGFFSRLARGHDKEEEKDDTPHIIQSLYHGLPEERTEKLLHHLQGLAKAVMGYDDSQGVSVDKPLTDQGFDSLMAVEMRNRLSKELAAPLPVSLLFDYPTLEKITAYLLEDVLELHEALKVQEGDVHLGTTWSAEAVLEEIDAVLEM
ncbi:MAG: type I polyketide synthase [Thermodesulfobacteriota bacterium]|nr:type I polyketide synthase [Thermodesulfobacteriota bacterium]